MHLCLGEIVDWPGRDEKKHPKENVSDAALVLGVLVDERLNPALEDHRVGLKRGPHNALRAGGVGSGFRAHEAILLVAYRGHVKEGEASG